MEIRKFDKSSERKRQIWADLNAGLEENITTSEYLENKQKQILAGEYVWLKRDVDANAVTSDAIYDHYKFGINIGCVVARNGEFTAFSFIGGSSRQLTVDGSLEACFSAVKILQLEPPSPAS